MKRRTHHNILVYQNTMTSLAALHRLVVVLKWNRHPLKVTTFFLLYGYQNIGRVLVKKIFAIFHLFQ